jgi:hypothetical protein
MSVSRSFYRAFSRICCEYSVLLHKAMLTGPQMVREPTCWTRTQQKPVHHASILFIRYNSDVCVQLLSEVNLFRWPYSRLAASVFSLIYYASVSYDGDPVKATLSRVQLTLVGFFLSLGNTYRTILDADLSVHCIGYVWECRCSGA